MAEFLSPTPRREGKSFLFVVAFIAALGGFLFGYDTGVISGAPLFINGDLHATQFEQQAIVGSLLLGAVAGARDLLGLPRRCHQSQMDEGHLRDDLCARGAGLCLLTERGSADRGSLPELYPSR